MNMRDNGGLTYLSQEWTKETCDMAVKSILADANGYLKICRSPNPHHINPRLRKWNSFSLSAVLKPFSFINRTIGIVLSSFALPFSFLPFPFILRTIYVGLTPFSMLFITLPLSIIPLVRICCFHNPLPTLQALVPISVVYLAIWIVVHSFPMP